MKKAFLAALCLLTFSLPSWGQSPNLSSAITKLQASDFQTRTEKGQADGYVPLNSSSLILPAYMMPGWSSASDFTIWGKKDGIFQKLNGLSLDANGLTINNIRIGQVSGSQLGVTSTINVNPLYLKAGTSSNKIYVSYNQTFGGSDITGTSFLWSIGSAGVFKLASGEFNGNVDFKNFAGSNLASIEGGSTIFNLSGRSITVSSGNFTFSLSGGGAGVIVPSTASAGSPTFALNVTSANTLYSRLGSNNTLTGINTFDQAPVVPDASFAIAKTSGLQAALDLILKKDGSNSATGNINFGGFRGINLAIPSASGDAVTLGYLQSHYNDDPVDSITATAPLSVTADTGDITISMPAATGSQNGYLSSTDWTTFNDKQGSLSATAPLVLVGSTLSIPVASTSVSGYLSSSSWNLFNAKENALTFSTPLSRSGNNVSIPLATASTAGYLSAADWIAFNAGTAAFGTYQNGDLPIGNSTLNGGVGGITKAKITSSDGYLTVVNGPGSIDLQMPTGLLDGQFLIGNSTLNAGSGGFTKARITAGSGIAIVNSAGGVTISATGSGGSGNAVSGIITSRVIVNATTTETSMFARAFAANGITTGNLVRVKLHGAYSISAGSDKFTLYLKYGSTVIASLDCPIPAGVISNEVFEAEFTFTVRSASASSNIIAHAYIKTYSLADTAGSATREVAVQQATTTVNLTSAQSINVTAVLSNGAAGNSVAVDQAFLTLN